MLEDGFQLVSQLMDRWSNCSAPLVKVTLVPQSTVQRRGPLQRAHSITGPLQVDSTLSIIFVHNRKILYRKDKSILGIVQCNSTCGTITRATIASALLIKVF